VPIERRITWSLEPVTDREGDWASRESEVVDLVSASTMFRRIWILACRERLRVATGSRRGRPFHQIVEDRYNRSVASRHR
jgi:hypothetical protein